MRFKGRIVSAFMVLAAVVTMIPGCGAQTADDTKQNSGNSSSVSSTSQLNATGLPIVNEPVTLKIMVRKQDVQPEFEKMLAFQEYEKLSGVKIEWDNLNSSNAGDKVKLAFASQDLPDAFMKLSISNIDQLNFGSQGLLLNLNELIDEYAPNVKKFMDEHPDVKKSQTFDNGAIYSLPAGVESSAVRLARKYYINKEWLKKVGMEMPASTDELYNVLKAFKENDANGNGKADEIPLASDTLQNIMDVLRGAFGIGNRGMLQQSIDMDEITGKIRYIQTSEQYKQFLQYLNKLYKEGLMDQEIFTIKQPQFIAKASEGLIGSFSAPNTATIPSQHVGEFEGLPAALKGPGGDQMWAALRPYTTGTGAFVITSANKYPEITMRWVDYFYGDDGIKLFNLGVEGKSYVKTADGKYDWSDEVYSGVNSTTPFDAVVSKYAPYVGGSNPTIIREPYFGGREMEEVSYKASMNLIPFAPKEVWPDFTFTVKENERLTVLRTDIDGYVTKMMSEFITGHTSFSEWNSYVDQINKMGLEEMLGIYTTAYERYKK